MPSPQIDWSVSDAPDEPGPPDLHNSSPSNPAKVWRRLTLTLVSVAIILGLGVWLSLRSGSPEHAVIVLVPSATMSPPAAAHVEPSATTPAPSKTPPPPSPTAQTTPVIAPITSALEPTAAAAMIAFVFQQYNSDAGDIYTMRVDGSHLVDVTNHPEPGYMPSWTPDGRQIAFISQRTGRPEVYLVRPDGSGLRQFTHTPQESPGVSGFAWSPDGGRLAVTYPTTSTTDQRFGMVELMRLDDSTTTTLSLLADQFQWSPDGKWLAFDGPDLLHNPALYVARGDGTRAQMIVDTQRPLTNTSESLMGLSWAPDSALLAYIVQGPLQGDWPNQEWGGGPSYTRIFTTRPDGSNQQLLLSMTPMPDGLIGPNWSPDGRYLLYLVGHSSNGCFTVHLLVVASRTDTALDNACYLPRTTMPDWSPDGRYLVLSAQPNSILLLDVADAQRHPQNVVGTWLTLGPDYTWDPVWQPLVR